MAVEFRMPDVGEGITEGEIVQWLIAEGAQVKEDDALVEVQTDKAIVQIPSPASGVVLRHGAAEGEVITVGSTLAVIGEAGEKAAPLLGKLIRRVVLKLAGIDPDKTLLSGDFTVTDFKI